MRFCGNSFTVLLFSSQGYKSSLSGEGTFIPLPFCTFLASQLLPATYLTLLITKLRAHLFLASIPGTKEELGCLKPLIFPDLLTHPIDVLQCQSQVGPSITRVIPKQL